MSRETKSGAFCLVVGVWVIDWRCQGERMKVWESKAIVTAEDGEACTKL